MLPKCVISLFLPISEANQREAFSKVWPNRREHRWNIRPDCKTNSVGILAPSPALTEPLGADGAELAAAIAAYLAVPPAGLKMEAAFGLAPGAGKL